MSKTLTVIVPSYNMEDYLPRNLGGMVVDPALMERLEVLVVNDGSKDRTSEIAHGFAAKYPGTFRVVDKENGNYGSCVNRGLAEATGFYVKVLDADDYVDTAAFADYLGVLDEEMGKGDAAADLVVTDYAKVDPDGHVLSRSRFGLGEGISTLADKPADSDWMAVQAVTYRTENLRRMDYRQTEGVSYTDMQWVLEPMSTVRRLRYVPRRVTYYLVGRSGQTMERETFIRNYGQVVRIVLDMVSRHDRLLQNAAPEARDFYHREIVGSAAQLYANVLVEADMRCHVRDLVAFDDALKANAALYRETDEVRLKSKRLPFRAVRAWRRRRSYFAPALVVFRLYKRVIRIVAVAKDFAVNSVRRGNRLALCGLGVSFLALFAINWWCLPAHDELAYTFQGECTPIMGQAHHIASLGDIVRSELAEYAHGPSGRVFLHGFVQLFAGWELYHLFDFCNTVVWFLLVWLVLLESGVRRSVQSFALGAAVLFWFYFYSETCTVNMAFAVNYLWTSCAVVLFVRAWRKHESWLMVPFAFVFGWWQEVFSLAVVAGLGLCGLVSLLRTRRYPWGGRRTAAYVALALGVIGCCGSHLLSGRAEESGAGGLTAVFLGIAKAQVALVLDVWPAVLLALVASVVWLKRRRLGELFSAKPEWWAIFAFGCVEYAFLGAEGLRIACPMLLAGVLLVMVNRGELRRLVRGLSTACKVLAIAWLAVACVLQYRVGRNLQTMLDVYRASPDGVTFRRAANVGLWGLSVSQLLHNEWHRALFRHQFGKDLPPVVLSPRLYETLYLDSRKFFQEANEVMPGGYALPGECGSVVVRGNGGFPADWLIRACKEEIARHSQGRWKFVPGRLRTIFPPTDLYVGMPSSPYELRTRDGETYYIITK